MTVTQPSKINMAVPQYRIDQIIGIHTGSFAIAAPTAISTPKTASDTFLTGFNDTCLIQGIFSVDGGVSWNDFGSYKPNLSTPAQPVLQTVTCQGWVTPTGTFEAYAQNFYDNVHSTGTAYTVSYKVVFLAKDDQGAITPIPTAELLNYVSSYNFQKIFLSGRFTNAGTPIVIAHNLGYVPKVRAWGTSTSVTPYPTGSMLSYDWFGGSNFNIEVDTNNVTFDSITGYGTVNIDYRIYLDS